MRNSRRGIENSNGHRIQVYAVSKKTNYNYFSDIYDVLQSIEDMLIANCEERNKAFVYYRFKKDDYRKAGHFRPTLLYIKENDFYRVYWSLYLLVNNLDKVPI